MTDFSKRSLRQLEQLRTSQRLMYVGKLEEYRFGVNYQHFIGTPRNYILAGYEARYNYLVELEEIYKVLCALDEAITERRQCIRIVRSGSPEY